MRDFQNDLELACLRVARGEVESTVEVHYDEVQVAEMKDVHCEDLEKACARVVNMVDEDPVDELDVVSSVEQKQHLSEEQLSSVEIDATNEVPASRGYDPDLSQGGLGGVLPPASGHRVDTDVEPVSISIRS